MRKPSVYLIRAILIITFTVAYFAAGKSSPAESGLTCRDLKIGSGETVEEGKVAVIHFSSWIDVDGKKGDLIFNSRQNDDPVAFKVGTNMVIKAWNIGLVGMRVGGVRRLMVPSHLGYGEKGSGDAIPPDTNLIFDIELLEVR
jgi:FKBP-type peptidyl-prolyl cis-trans isomerase